MRSKIRIDAIPGTPCSFEGCRNKAEVVGTKPWCCSHATQSGEYESTFLTPDRELSGERQVNFTVVRENRERRLQLAALFLQFDIGEDLMNFDNAGAKAIVEGQIALDLRSRARGALRAADILMEEAAK